MVVLIHEGKREIVPSYAKIDDVHTSGELAATEMPDDLDPEPVVAHEDVADPGYENPWRRGFRRLGRRLYELQLGRRKEEPMRGRARPEGSARVVVEHDHDVLLPAVIPLDGRHSRQLTRQREIENVAPHFGLKPHAIPGLQRGHTGLIVPCSFMSCSAARDCVRSNSARPFSSDARISRCSSSVSVRIRSDRISSISVLS